VRRILVLLAALSMPAAAQELSLAEIFSSVDRAYPLLARAMQERALAEAGLLEAQGGFDLKLKSKADTKQFGFYRRRKFGARNCTADMSAARVVSVPGRETVFP
jgi:hypothetical protein